MLTNLQIHTCLATQFLRVNYSEFDMLNKFMGSCEGTYLVFYSKLCNPWNFLKKLLYFIKSQGKAQDFFESTLCGICGQIGKLTLKCHGIIDFLL